MHDVAAYFKSVRLLTGNKTSPKESSQWKTTVLLYDLSYKPGTETVLVLTVMFVANEAYSIHTTHLHVH